MTEDTPLPFDLPAVHRKKITVDFNGGNQSSDAGLLLLREAERKLGVCQRLAAAIPDRRDPDRILHTMHEMLMERVSAIACGDRGSARVATNHLSNGEFAEQNGRGASCCGYARSVLLVGNAGRS